MHIPISIRRYGTVDGSSGSVPNLALVWLVAGCLTLSVHKRKGSACRLKARFFFLPYSTCLLTVGFCFLFFIYVVEISTDSESLAFKVLCVFVPFVIVSLWFQVISSIIQTCSRYDSVLVRMYY